MLVASGGVVAAASIVLGALSLAANAEAEDLCSDEGGATLCLSEARGSIDRAGALGIAADVSAGVGLVALAVGIVWLLVNRSRGDETSVRAMASRSGMRIGASF